MTILDRYQGFVFDLDGTVYLGEDLLPGARDVIASIRAGGRKLLYLTNKPLHTSAEYADKLTRLGLPTTAEEVLSSLDALMTYLHSHHPRAQVLPVAEPLLVSTLQAHGFTVVPAHLAREADVVAVSFDRTFDYAKLTAAYHAVGAGAAIVATNPDGYCPTPDGGLPDCGAMLAAIEACTGVRAEAVVGKPSTHTAASILQRLGLPAGQVLLLGDRVDTDMLMARNAGMAGALVLTGVTGPDAARRADPAPTYILSGLAELADQPQALR